VPDGHEGSATCRLYRLFVDAKKGSAAARGELLTALRPRIFRFVLKRVGGTPAAHEVAEDITQDVLLRIHDGLLCCRARSEAQLVAWTFTIARHAVIDWRRKRTLEEAAPGDARAPSLRNVAEGAPERPSPEDRLLGELLLAAQATLNPDAQEVIRQRLLYGATWRVAGEAIGTTAGGAKRRWQRALVRLKREVLLEVGKIQDESLRRAVLNRLGRNDS
jgi:RNA polymerase sigma factor (sigma-70 family)